MAGTILALFVRVISALVIAGSVWGAGVGATSLPPTHVTAQVPVPKGTRVSHKILADDYTLMTVWRPGVPNLEGRLRRAFGRSQAMEVRTLASGHQEAVLQFENRLVASRVRDVKGAVELFVDYRMPHEDLSERVMRPLPRTVPSTVLAPSFFPAEMALQSNLMRDAARRFEKLSEQSSLKPWSILRLADIAMMRGNVAHACQRYGYVVHTYGRRTAGMLAQLRAHVLRCPRRNTDWETSVIRLRRLDGIVGDFLWREAMWSVSQTRSTHEITRLLRLLDENDGFRPQRGRLSTPHASLLARLIRLPSDPFEIATSCFRNAGPLTRHREARSLLLSCARAFSELDLVGPASVALEQALDTQASLTGSALWRERSGDEQALRVLAATYFELGDVNVAQETSRAFLARYGDPLPLGLTPQQAAPDVFEAWHVLNAAEDRLAVAREEVIRQRRSGVRVTQGRLPTGGSKADGT